LAPKNPCLTFSNFSWWAVAAEEPQQAAFDLRLTLAHLDSPEPAGKAALLTFPNKNRFSLYQDWRTIIICSIMHLTTRITWDFVE
jgi:hypothetical protein